MGRDDPFRFGADVYQEALAVLAYDDAFDDLAAAERRVSEALLFKESLHLVLDSVLTQFHGGASWGVM
jgi:hypothetical protein